QQRLLLGAFRRILLADADDLPQHLGVEAVALGLGVNLLDVVGDGPLLLLHALDALDEGADLVLRHAVGRNGWLSGHDDYLGVTTERPLNPLPPGCSSPISRHPPPLLWPVGNAREPIARRPARALAIPPKAAISR